MNPEIPPADCGEYLARLEWRFCDTLEADRRARECAKLPPMPEGETNAPEGLLGSRVYRSGRLESYGNGHNVAGW